LARSERDPKWHIHDALKRAENAHGHLCPFLALGVRTSLVGLRELETNGNNEDLRVALMLQNPASYPCLLDGIQLTTGCTIGNKKLRLLNSPQGITARFELPNKETVTVAVKSASFNKLADKMSKVMSGKVTSEEFEQLVSLVVSMPEEELFTVKRE